MLFGQPLAMDECEMRMYCPWDWGVTLNITIELLTTHTAEWARTKRESTIGYILE